MSSMSEHQQQDAAAPSVAVYMRVSTSHGTVETQRPDLDRYLAAYGLKPYGWYEDAAVSGHWIPFAERPQGRRLLADAQAGHVNLVLVWRLDRFGRDAREIHNAVHELEEVGARLLSLKESFDTRTSAGKLMLGILASVSEFEWASIQERTAAGIERKLDGGGWMGGPVPYGYRVEGKGTDARLVLDDTPLGIPEYPQLSAADVVRLIYSLTVDEHLSGQAIADKLNTMSVPTSYQRRERKYTRDGRMGPGQHVWRANAVNGIIHNSVYKGVYQFGRRSRHHAGCEVVTCDVPALVSVDTWDAAAAQLEKNLRFSARNATYDYLLKGLIRCGLCGYHYISDVTWTGPQYVCIAHRRPLLVWGSKALAEERRCRDSLPVRAVSIERDVWRKVERYLRHPDEALAELAVLLHGQADAAGDVRAQLAGKQRELDTLQEERDRILTYHAKGRMSERDLDRQMDRIAGEERKVAADVAKLTAQLGEADAIADKLAAAAALLEQLRGSLDEGPMTPERQRVILDKLVRQITIKTEINEATLRPWPAIYVHLWFDPEPDNEDELGSTTSTPGHGRCPQR